MKKVTIKDIAKIAGVSAPVVSVALSGKQGSTTNISQATRDKILKIAKDLNYRPNLSAQSLKSNKSYLIGIMLYDTNKQLMGELLYGLQKALSQASYAPIFLNHKNKAEQAQHLEFLLNRGIDALLINAWVDEDTGAIDKELTGNLPKNLASLEAFGWYCDGLPKINFDFTQAYRSLTSELIQRGEKDITLFVQEGYEKGKDNGAFFNSWNTYSAYHDEMMKANIEPKIQLLARRPTSDDAFIQSSYEQAKELISQKKLSPTLMTTDLNQAEGIIQACQEELSPAELTRLKIVAYGDKHSRLLRKHLIATVYPEAEKAGEVLAQKILKKINGKHVDSALLPLRQDWY